MKHPMASIPSTMKRPLFVVLLVLTLIVMVALQWLGQPLRTDTAPAGIVSFEFAGDSETADAILDSWDPDAKILAGFNIGLDYLFLVAYSTTIALAIVWTTESWISAKWLLAVAALLAWAQWFAAVLDAVENAALLVMLVNTTASPWPGLAQWCAIGKFGLVILGLLYVGIMVIIHMFQRRKRIHSGS